MARKPFLKMDGRPGETPARLAARELTRPDVRAAQSVHAYTYGAQQDLQPLVSELAQQSAEIKAGRLDRMEEMLSAQAHTLDAIFNRLALDAAGRLVDAPAMADTLLRLALKAQSQCRATIEAVAMIQNPPSVAFVRQANIAHGPQQIINEGAARPRETARSPNELLEKPHEPRMDCGTTSPAGRAHPKLEALATLDRPAHADRQEGLQQEPLEGRHAPDAPGARSRVAGKRAVSG
jgi:hypothetical protein